MDKNNHYCVYGCLYCLVTNIYEHIEYLEIDKRQLATQNILLRKDIEEMDKDYKKLLKKEKGLEKDTKKVLAKDKTRDKYVEKGKKAMKGKC